MSVHGSNYFGIKCECFIIDREATLCCPNFIPVPSSSEKMTTTSSQETALQVQVIQSARNTHFTTNGNELNVVYDLLLSAQQLRNLDRQKIMEDTVELKSAENRMGIELKLIGRSMEKLLSKNMVQKNEHLSRLLSQERKLKKMEKESAECAHFVKSLYPKFKILEEQINKMSVSEASIDSKAMNTSSPVYRNEAKEAEPIEADQMESSDGASASNKQDEDDEKTAADDGGREMQDAGSKNALPCSVCEASFTSVSKLFRHNAIKHKPKISAKKRSNKTVKAARKMKRLQ